MPNKIKLQQGVTAAKERTMGFGSLPFCLPDVALDGVKKKKKKDITRQSMKQCEKYSKTAQLSLCVWEFDGVSLFAKSKIRRVQGWRKKMERAYTCVCVCVCCIRVKFLPLVFFFLFFPCDCNSLSYAGCCILTTQLLMAYVLPSSS